MNTTTALYGTFEIEHVALDNARLNELLANPSCRIWFTSDLHFNHKNILKFESDARSSLFVDRPVEVDGQSIAVNADVLRKLDEQEDNVKRAIVDEMDKRLVEQWNSMIGTDDVVFFLGDWTVQNKVSDKRRNFLRETIKSLNGNIVMINGNHDNVMGIGDLLLARVDYMNIALPVKINDEIETRRFILSHYPICNWDGKHRGAVHLYGHLHTGTEGDGIIACWDTHLKPLSIDEVMAIYNQCDFESWKHHDK